MASKKRKLILAGAALVVAAAAVIVASLGKSHDRITEANFKRLAVGMPIAEVERIFGGPAGRYSERGWAYTLGLSDPSINRNNKNWYGEDGAAFLTFDHNGKLLSMFYDKTNSGSSTGYWDEILRHATALYHRFTE